jgi:hypothetical protein
MEEVSIAVESPGPARHSRRNAWASVPFDVVLEDEALPAYFARWRAAGATGPSPLLPWAKAPWWRGGVNAPRERAAAGALPPLTTWLAPPTTSCRRCGRAVLAGVCACGRDDDE